MKTAAESASKFVSRAGAASGDYVDGAMRTAKDQAANAIAAAPNYVAGVQASIAAKRFESGLQKSGKAKWQRGVSEKGSARFASGVATAQDAYATNSGRYDGARGAAASMPRGPKGDERNYARSKAVGAALRAMKVGK